MRKRMVATFVGLGFAAVASAQVPAPGAAIPTTGTLHPGMPVMRSFEYTFNRASTDPGRYRAAGYRSWIVGLTPAELFAPPATILPGVAGAVVDPLLAALGTANETTARFTHTEAGCLYETIPKTPNLSAALVPNLAEPTATTTHARARQCLYYQEKPANRAWTRPSSFTKGKLAAVLHLVDETDFIDLVSRTGVGTATVQVACANDLTLSSGRPFNLGSLASSYVADFQFQLQPKASSLEAGYQDLTVVFADSGVWKVLERNAVPACGTEADLCAKPIAKCP